MRETETENLIEYLENFGTCVARVHPLDYLHIFVIGLLAVSFKQMYAETEEHFRLHGFF